MVRDIIIASSSDKVRAQLRDFVAGFAGFADAGR